MVVGNRQNSGEVSLLAGLQDRMQRDLSIGHTEGPRCNHDASDVTTTLNKAAASACVCRYLIHHTLSRFGSMFRHSLNYGSTLIGAGPSKRVTRDRAENARSGISTEDHDAGMKSSLDHLARFVENR